MVVAAVVLAVAAAAVAAAGAIQQGKATEQAMEYNAKVAEVQGEQARLNAGYEEGRQRDRAERLRSSQLAAYAKSGVAYEGSPLLVVEGSAVEAEMDALAIRHAGSIENARMKAQAAADRMAGRQARVSSYYQAGSTLLSGASKAFAMGAGGGGPAAGYSGGTATNSMTGLRVGGV